jgi:hypothetical protein
MKQRRINSQRRHTRQANVSQNCSVEPDTSQEAAKFAQEAKENQVR